MDASTTQRVQELIRGGNGEGIMALIAELKQAENQLRDQLAAFNAPALGPRLKFPDPPKPEIFYGMDSKTPNVFDWLYEINLLFSIWPMSDEQKIAWATLFMRGWAQTWWQQCQSMMAAGTLEPIVTWPSLM